MSADIYVIVNKDNSIESLEQKQVIDIFMGKASQFENGLSAYTIDQPSNSKIKEAFYKRLTGKPIAYVNAYWARLFYTGRKTPPADHFKSSDEIITEVRNNKNAIAYIESATKPENVKVVLTLE